jgi:hypothetical protein
LESRPVRAFRLIVPSYPGLIALGCRISPLSGLTRDFVADSGTNPSSVHVVAILRPNNLLHTGNSVERCCDPAGLESKRATPDLGVSSASGGLNPRLIAATPLGVELQLRRPRTHGTKPASLPSPHFEAVKKSNQGDFLIKMRRCRIFVRTPTDVLLSSTMLKHKKRCVDLRFKNVRKP